MARDRGESVLPPEDLASRALPLRNLKPRTWSRIHAVAFEPCYYSENPGNRFSSAGVKVLYFADKAVTAFWEIFWDDLGTRAEKERRISRAKLNQRVVRNSMLKRSLLVFDATHPKSLKAASAPTATFSGDYRTCQLWARALLDYPLKPAGILYPSARHGGGACLAAFADRTDCADFEFGDPTGVGNSPPILAAALDDGVVVLDD